MREIRQRDAHVGITLIAPLAELHYLPGIVWIPSGLCTREQLVVPLANFFKRMNVRHIAAEVTIPIGLIDFITGSIRMNPSAYVRLQRLVP